VSDWIGLYEEGGIEKIQEVGAPGPEPGQESIPSEVMEALKERLSEPEGFGSFKEIQQWLAEEHRIELPYSTVHGIVRYEIGAKPKVPRPSHPKKPAGENRIPGKASRLPLKPKCQHARTPVLPG
jgi:hypothetical protein